MASMEILTNPNPKPTLNYGAAAPQTQAATRRRPWAAAPIPNAISFTQGTPTDLTDSEIANAIEEKLPEGFPLQMHSRDLAMNPYFYHLLQVDRFVGALLGNHWSQDQRKEL